MEEETDISELLPQYPSSYYSGELEAYDADVAPPEGDAADASEDLTYRKESKGEGAAEEVFPGWQDDAEGENKEATAQQPSATQVPATARSAAHNKDRTVNGRFNNRPEPTDSHRGRGPRPFGNARGHGRLGSGQANGRRGPAPPQWQAPRPGSGFGGPPSNQDGFTGPPPPRPPPKFNPDVQGMPRENENRMPVRHNFEELEPKQMRMPMDMPSIFKMPGLDGGPGMMPPPMPMPILPPPLPMRGPGVNRMGAPGAGNGPRDFMPGDGMHMGGPLPPPDMMMADKETLLPDYDSGMPRNKRPPDEMMLEGHIQRRRLEPPMHDGPGRVRKDMAGGEVGMRGRLEPHRPPADNTSRSGAIASARSPEGRAPGGQLRTSGHDMGMPGRGHMGTGDMHMGGRGRPMQQMASADGGLHSEMHMGGRAAGMARDRPPNGVGPHPRLVNGDGPGFRRPPPGALPSGPSESGLMRPNPPDRPQLHVAVPNDQHLMAGGPNVPFTDTPFEGAPIRLRGIHGPGSGPPPPRAPPGRPQQPRAPQDTGVQEFSDHPHIQLPSRSLAAPIISPRVTPGGTFSGEPSPGSGPLSKQWVRGDGGAAPPVGLHSAPLPAPLLQAAAPVQRAPAAEPASADPAASLQTKLELDRKLSIIEARRVAQEKEAANRELQAKLLKAQEEQIALHKRMIELMEAKTKKTGVKPAAAGAKLVRPKGAVANGKVAASAAAAVPAAAPAVQNQAAVTTHAPAAQQTDRPSAVDSAVAATAAAAIAPMNKEPSPPVALSTQAPSASRADSRSATPDRGAGSAESSERHREKKAKKQRREKHKKKSSKRRREESSPVESEPEHQPARAERESRRDPEREPTPKRPQYDDPRRGWAEDARHTYHEDSRYHEEEFMALPKDDDRWVAEDESLQPTDLRHMLRKTKGPEADGGHEREPHRERDQQWDRGQRNTEVTVVFKGFSDHGKGSSQQQQRGHTSRREQHGHQRGGTYTRR